MHRTNRVPRSVLGGLLLGLLLGGLPPAMAQEALPVPRPVDGKSPSLIVSINGTQRLRMKTGRPIKEARNSTENIARLSPVAGDPTQVLIIGLDSGLTHITLTDTQGITEEYDVIVQTDVEYLRSLIRRAVPTANIDPIPAANNTIILTGTVEHSEDIDPILRIAQSVVLGPDRIINMMRVGGVMQVQLCVTVADVVRSDFRRMAFDFLFSDETVFGGSTGSGAVVTPATVGFGSQQLSINGMLQGVPGAPAGANTNLFFGILNPKSGFLAFLQALRDENVAKLIAEPRLVTQSGRPASFLNGGEQAVPIPAGLGQVGVQFEEFGTRVNFLPVVLGNGKIHLEVEPEVSALDAGNGTNISGAVVPGRVTRRVHTSVEMEDGQTFVIGGLIQRTESATTRRIPVLGDLPFVGTAFRSISHQEQEEELVILVTVNLVDPLDCSQLPKVLPGEETRRPDDFELFLEGILEAPRGPRDVCHDKVYWPAWKNSPSAALFPCAGGHHGHDDHGGPAPLWGDVGSCCGEHGCPCGAPHGIEGPIGDVLTKKPAPAGDALAKQPVPAGDSVAKNPVPTDDALKPVSHQQASGGDRLVPTPVPPPLPVPDWQH
jgi:pilus assembly protein CpaC